jgi:predicted DNA-binding transcriptional regulator AlpA
MRLLRHFRLLPPPPAGAVTCPIRPNLPPRFLRTPEAARFLGLSGRTLEKHRYFGTGPAYRRIGGRVVYSVDDLRAWADIGIKHSTSDPGQDDLMPRADSAIARSRR